MNDETKAAILHEMAKYNIGPVRPGDVMVIDIMQEFDVSEDQARKIFDRYLADHPECEKVDAINPHGGPKVKVIRKKDVP